MKFIIPVLLLILYTPVSAEWDLMVSHYFFNNGAFSTNAFWSFIYMYGPLPTDLTVAGASILLLLSYSFKRIAHLRKTFLLLILTLAIGSGLIAHALLKDHWGRPRPRQTTEFGGVYPFFPFYEPNLLGSQIVPKLPQERENPEKLRSFPCGHCTMGYFFFALALALKRQRKYTLSILAYAFALTLGILLSLARIAVGGHFLSDTLVALLIMWLTAASLDAILFRKGESVACSDP